MVYLKLISSSDVLCLIFRVYRDLLFVLLGNYGQLYQLSIVKKVG